MKKTVARRLLIFGTLSLIIIIYFIITFFDYTFRLVDLKKQESALIKELRNKVAENIEMEEELKKLSDKEYLANYAREHYMYTADGEIIIKIIDEINEEEIIIEKERNIIVISVSSIALIFIAFISANKIIDKKTKQKVS